jgi:hypothetical protein
MGQSIDELNPTGLDRVNPGPNNVGLSIRNDAQTKTLGVHVTASGPVTVTGERALWVGDGFLPAAPYPGAVAGATVSYTPVNVAVNVAGASYSDVAFTASLQDAGQTISTLSSSARIC